MYKFKMWVALAVSYMQVLEWCPALALLTTAAASQGCGIAEVWFELI